jgi:hypothetical protein
MRVIWVAEMLDWLKKRTKDSRSKPEFLRIRRVVFVVEQDGDIERILKARLVERFRSSIQVTEAYLVGVRYDDSPQLKTDGKLANYDLVRVASSEFTKIFARTESLDTIFLTPAQEQQISVVARPFYRQSLPRV